MTALTPEVLHFTGHSDLLSTFAELRLDILRARCNGRINHDAERRQASVGRTITTGQLPLEGGNG